MKSFILLLVLLISTTIVSSQSLTHRLISSGGTFSESQSYKLSYSLGETFVSQLNSATMNLSAGFQQIWNVTVGVDDVSGNYEIRAYPNPVAETLTIRFKDIDQDFLYVELFTLRGELIMSKKIEGPLSGRYEGINVSNIGAGLLILKIRTGYNKVILTVPIVKN